MTLTVTTDLSVNTGPSRLEEKLEDKQKALRESIEKGQPKIFGVDPINLHYMTDRQEQFDLKISKLKILWKQRHSILDALEVSQIVIGLLIISYSIPLLSTETTLILNFGVPWWSGFMFVISGTAAILVEKIATVKTVSACLAVSFVTIIISVIALILYYVDIASNPATTCHMGSDQLCDQQYYATRFSTGMKITISIVNIVQTALSSAFAATLYNQRKNFTSYATLGQ